MRIFSADGVEVQALQGLDLLVDRGELIAIVGASGSGKSTLLNILAGLDAPTAGTARVAGHDLLAMSARDRLGYRRERRRVHLAADRPQPAAVPDRRGERRAADAAAGGRERRRGRRAGELLGALGRRPLRATAGRTEMSGGEQQRVAIAVALANEPAVLLADEPTGELDTATATEVFAALRTVNGELGATVVIVTHDPAVAGQVRRTVAIRDGRTSTETLRRAPTDDRERTLVSERVRRARPGRPGPAAARDDRRARA